MNHYPLRDKPSGAWRNANELNEDIRATMNRIRFLVRNGNDKVLIEALSWCLARMCRERRIRETQTGKVASISINETN